MKTELERLFGGTAEVGVSTVDVTWPGGGFSFAELGDTAYFRSIASAGPGGLTEVIVKLPPFLREHGFRYATVYNDGPAAASWLAGVGFERDDQRQGLWRADLAVGGRMDQYAAWKSGAPEPDWHKALPS